MPLVYESFDASAGRLVLITDRFARLAAATELVRGRRYCIDRRPLGIRGRLQEVVRAGFADPLVRAVVEGEHRPQRDTGRHARALAALAATGLDAAQQRAGAAAIATESLALVPGPPGTGKTRLLAAVVRILGRAGCRIALTAYTHRAVDHALHAIRNADPDLPLFKVGNPGPHDDELRALGVALNARGNGIPQAGALVAGTCFAIAKLAPTERFHLTVFDEAGQLPIAHAIAGMLLARRWLWFGDHAQLPPVIAAEHADREITESAFERLHRLYGSELLDTSYRMNDGVCDVVSRAFYGGRVHAAPAAAARRLPFRAGGALDAVLDPERPVVLARIDHAQPGPRSLEEAALVADLCDELVGRHGVAPTEIAVVAPFRAQVRQIRAALQRRGSFDASGLVVDTVERIQGQEREVVLVSLATGDPDALDRRAAFFFSTHRLNVALSRARTKAVLIASGGVFDALPRDVDDLRAASVWKRLRDELPQVDLTARYATRGT
jgi:DNA replication ATP-dependent helicase Dna2